MLEQCAKAYDSSYKNKRKRKKKKRGVGLGYFELTKNVRLSFLIESISARNGLLLQV